MANDNLWFQKNNNVLLNDDAPWGIIFFYLFITFQLFSRDRNKGFLL